MPNTFLDTRLVDQWQAVIQVGDRNFDHRLFVGGGRNPFGLHPEERDLTAGSAKKAGSCRRYTGVPWNSLGRRAAAQFGTHADARTFRTHDDLRLLGAGAPASPKNLRCQQTNASGTSIPRTGGAGQTYTSKLQSGTDVRGPPILTAPEVACVSDVVVAIDQVSPRPGAPKPARHSITGGNDHGTLPSQQARTDDIFRRASRRRERFRRNSSTGS